LLGLFERSQFEEIRRGITVKKNILFFAAVCLCVCGVSVVRAQAQTYTGPPKVITIGREEVKPGKGGAHTKMETAWARAFAESKVATNWIGMTSVSGNDEVWFVSGYESLAAVEKNRQGMDNTPAWQALNEKFAAQESDLLSGMRSLIGMYREELSYQGIKTNVGEMRYLYVTTVRVRPGHENDFIEATKIAKAAHEKANVPERWSVFEVTLGMPHGTYLIIEPLKTLADVDAFPQTHGQAYRDAVGDDGRKRLAELANSGTNGTETNIFAFSPEMSIPLPEIAAADPNFWHPKPMKKAAPAAKKGEEKPATKQ
jgi:hypothetical protein